MLKSLSPSTISVSTNSVFHSDDILFGKLRPNLKKCVRATFSGYCSTEILVFQASDGIEPRFAAQVFRWDRVFDEAVKTAEGTRMPRTSWPKLKEFLVRIPPLPEQRRIAEILDTVDDVIQQTEALIAKLKLMKAGLLHDLLTRGIDENGELRDPEAHPEQFKDSPLGRIPREWRLAKLGDI